MSNNCAPIVIAGAGIAGLSAAIALRLADFDAIVLERDAEVRVFGAGLQLGPSATRRLQSWDVDLSGVSSAPKAIRLCQARSGRELNQLPLGKEAQDRFSAPYLTLLRADLHAALLDRAANLNIPLYFNSPVVAAKQEVKALSVQGPEASPISTSALIGADGVYSAVRGLFSRIKEPAYAHATAWRGFIPTDLVSQARQDTITVWMAPGGHLVHYPVARGEIHNAVLVMDDDARADFANPDGSFAIDRLLSHFSEWADEPRALIASCQEWRPWPIMMVIQKQSGWGRIQLIGDAWHAMPPYLASGAVLAIEDADVLAACLRQYAPDILTGMQAFRAQRRSRLNLAYRQSQRMGRIYHFPRPFDFVRDQAISLLPGEVLLKRQAWLYGY